MDEMRSTVRKALKKHFDDRLKQSLRQFHLLKSAPIPASPEEATSNTRAFFVEMDSVVTLRQLVLIDDLLDGKL